MNIPAEYDINVLQGATFQWRVTWKDSLGVAIDLTGYTARMQIRERRTSTDTLVNLTTENGGIALGGAAGHIDITIAAAATAAITALRGVYDLEIVSPAGVVYRLAMGGVTFSPEVTR